MDLTSWVEQRFLPSRVRFFLHVFKPIVCSGFKVIQSHSGCGHGIHICRVFDGEMIKIVPVSRSSTGTHWGWWAEITTRGEVIWTLIGRWSVFGWELGGRSSGGLKGTALTAVLTATPEKLIVNTSWNTKDILLIFDWYQFTSTVQLYWVFRERIP